MASYGSDEVFIIDYGTTPPNITNISLPAGPIGVAVNPTTDLVYVTAGDKVYVIEGSTKNILPNAKPIEVGSGAANIAVNPNTNVVYVTHDDSTTLDLINGSTNTVINGSTNTEMGKKNSIGIPDPDLPTEVHVNNAVAVNPKTNMIYAVNQASDKLYVFDGSTNKPLVGVKFKINPPDAGSITCSRYYSILGSLR